MKKLKFKQETVAFLIIMFTNVLGAIFQVITGKSLNNVEEYGILNTLLSTFTILAIPATIITYVIIKRLLLFIARLIIAKYLRASIAWLNSSIGLFNFL